MQFTRVLVIIPPEPDDKNEAEAFSGRRTVPLTPRIVFGWSRMWRPWFSWRWGDSGPHLTSILRDGVPFNDVHFVDSIDQMPFRKPIIRCSTHSGNGDTVYLPPKQALIFLPRDGEECIALCEKYFAAPFMNRIKRVLPSEAVWRPECSVRFRVGETTHDARVTAFSIHPWTGTIRVTARNGAFFDGYLGDDYWTWVVSKMHDLVGVDPEGNSCQLRVPMREQEEQIPLDQVLSHLIGDGTDL